MAVTNIGSLLPPLLLSLLLLPSPIHATVTVETSRLLSGDNTRVYKDGQATEAMLRASYIPVHVSLLPLDGDRVKLTGGRNLWFVHRHRNLVDMERPRLRRLADVTEDGVQTMSGKRVFTVRRMLRGCGGMGGGGMLGAGKGRRRESMMGGDSARRIRMLVKPSRD